MALAFIRPVTLKTPRTRSIKRWSHKADDDKIESGKFTWAEAVPG